MDRKLDASKVVGLIFGIAAIICIIISMFMEKDNIYLTIGLVCNCIALLFYMVKGKEKK